MIDFLVIDAAILLPVYNDLLVVYCVLIMCKLNNGIYASGQFRFICQKCRLANICHPNLL